MSQHQWSYMKESWIDDETVGPIDETAFLQQLRDGTIKPHWTVGSPTRTKRQWVKAQDNAICNQAIVEGRAQVREEKEKAKSLKRAEREQQNRQAEQTKLLKLQAAELDRKAAELAEREESQRQAEAIEKSHQEELSRQRDVIASQPAQPDFAGVISNPAPQLHATPVYQQPVKISQQVHVHTTYRENKKSVGLALMLTFLFGPFGMFYCTVSGAIVMILLWFLSCIPAVLTLGFSMILTVPLLWTIQLAWAAWAASDS